ncbi:hypothetical protein [Gordonia sp. NPDC003585]|uniref:hypothetical protein n=1 Tax=Gordonia sp. NPDC003585 TaxID=3154275 RepID=UPI0033BF6434
MWYDEMEMTVTSAVTTLNDAIRRAQAARPDRIVLAYGWEDDNTFLLSTHNPSYPENMRDEEEDGLIICVSKSDAAVTSGAYLQFMQAISSMREVGTDGG